MIRQPNLSISDLRDLVELDASTGVLTWKNRHVRFFSDSPRNDAASLADGWNHRWAGKQALNGTDRKGYLRGRLLGQKFRAHQVVFALTHGRWPTCPIDHIDGNPANNVPSNLREVTASENCRNTKLSVTNTTGRVGVYPGHSGKFCASIYDGGKQVHIGTFDSIESAAEARASEEKRLGYHENHGRVR